MKLYILKTITLLFSVFIISGCATIVSKSKYDVSIDSNPQGAKIKIMDSSGSIVHEGTTPDTVILAAGAGFFQGQDYIVELKMPGYRTQTVKIQRSVDSWYLIGNLFFGGLIGYIVVDPMTGAMWTLNDVEVQMSPGTAVIDKDKLIIASINDIPNSLKDQLVRIQ